MNRDIRRAIVYRIYNKITKKSYIGSTCNNVFRRWSAHIRLLNKNYYKGIFQKDWNKYGCTVWNFSILENKILLKDKFDREQYWMNKYGEYNIKKLKKIFIDKVIKILKNKKTFRYIRDKLDISLGRISYIKRKYISGNDV